VSEPASQLQDLESKPLEELTDDELRQLARNGGNRVPGELSPEEIAEVHARNVARTIEGNHKSNPDDPLWMLTSFQQRQDADLPPRLWFVDGMITPGFCMFTGKKSMGKSWLLLHLADSIAEGQPFLGRQVIRAKVLYVAFELDEQDTNERFRAMGRRLSENAYIQHFWPAEDKGFDLAEKAITEYGFKVIIFDSFLPLLPATSVFDINGYGDSTFYLRWRLLGKRNGAAIVASWHEGKSPRDDFMLNSIGSTGMVGQADCVVSIDRKRGDSGGKLWIGGNHAPDTAVPFFFENGIFSLAEGQGAVEHLSTEEERTLAVLDNHPEGCSPTRVAVETGKSDHAALGCLNRLIARGKASRVKRGVYISQKVSEGPKRSQSTPGDLEERSYHISPPYRGEI